MTTRQPQQGPRTKKIPGPVVIKRVVLKFGPSSLKTPPKGPQESPGVRKMASIRRRESCRTSRRPRESCRNPQDFRTCPLYASGTHIPSLETFQREPHYSTEAPRSTQSRQRVPKSAQSGQDRGAPRSCPKAPAAAKTDAPLTPIRKCGVYCTLYPL